MFDLVSSLEWPHLIIGVGSAEAPPDLFAHCDLVLPRPDDVTRSLALMGDWAA